MSFRKKTNQLFNSVSQTRCAFCISSLRFFYFQHRIKIIQLSVISAPWCNTVSPLALLEAQREFSRFMLRWWKAELPAQEYDKDGSILFFAAKAKNKKQFLLCVLRASVVNFFKFQRKPKRAHYAVRCRSQNLRSL